jgi:hypothetical protein
VTDERLALIVGLPLDEFLAELLADNAHLSANELAAAAKAAGKPCSKGVARRIRDAWVARKAGQPEDVDVTGEVPTIEQVERNLAGALAARDGQSSERWARTWARMKGLVTTDQDKTDGLDWSLLTENERAVLYVLTAKGHGQALDDDGLWIMQYVARMPPPPRVVHPAHVPLPDAPRPAIVKV